MDRNKECKCCLEVPEVVSKNSEVTGPFPSCITLHPGSLQTAWYQYGQQYSKCYDGPERKLNRQCTLPSCAVFCIRAHFPPPGLEEDFVFEGFHFPDE